MIVANWLLDTLLFVSGLIVWPFVDPNDIHFGLLQMVVAVSVIILFVAIGVSRARP
jgi:uncharacterized membrane protein